MDMGPVVVMMLPQSMELEIPTARRFGRHRGSVPWGLKPRDSRLGALNFGALIFGALIPWALVLWGCSVETSSGVEPSSQNRPAAAAGEGQSQESPSVPLDEAQKETQRGKGLVTVEQLKVKIEAIYPHDPTAFTQGLVWDGGVLYESTGLYGKSSLRQVDPTTGRVLHRKALDPNLFGEGLALVEDRLVQLTWKAGVAFAYDLATLEVIDEFGYNGEGWGLAYDQGRLLMSDGSSRITYRDPQDFRWRSTLEIRHQGRPMVDLNELEFAEGDLYANVWGQERILRIDPENGVVNAVIDASGLLEEREKTMVDVLNGIAYDPLSKTFWLTGKFWPKMFQVTFVPVEATEMSSGG